MKIKYSQDLCESILEVCKKKLITDGVDFEQFKAMPTEKKKEYKNET